jgi:hypothetical protein
LGPDGLIPGILPGLKEAGPSISAPDAAGEINVKAAIATAPRPAEACARIVTPRYRYQEAI